MFSVSDVSLWLDMKLKGFLFIPGDDISEDEEEGDEKASKTPHPLSSAALIKLAEGDEDVVEDLQLSDDEWDSRAFLLSLKFTIFLDFWLFCIFS